MSIDPKFVELTADVLEIFLQNGIEGLLQTQATLCAGLSIKQGRFSTLLVTRSY